MAKKIVKSRIIYSNYDLSETYPDEDLKQTAIDCEWIDKDEEITDEMLWNWRYQEDEFQWEEIKNELDEFFDDKKTIFIGSVGRWNGVYQGGRIGSFWDNFNSAMKDCDYVKFYDENGHLFMHCSHHDGSCSFEIKILTEKGQEYLDNWEDDWNDNRSEQYVHNQIFKNSSYSVIPNFMHKVYGAKTREYEEITKSVLIDKLNNSAKSFYC